MFDPALIEAPYHEEIYVDGETKTIGSLKVFYDDLYAYLEETPEGVSVHATSCVEQVSLELYIRASCPYCQRVMTYLKNTYGKVPKSIQVKDIGNNPQYGNELIQVGGKRQVPCLVINGEALYESKDIIEWLKENSESVK